MLTCQRHQHQRGFTLAEILVTTAIFAIIMMAALAVYDRSNRVFKTGAEAADMQQSTRIGFDKLVSDVRMAGFDYNRGGQPTNAWQVAQPDEQIEYAGPTAIVFRANFNYNAAGAAGNGLEQAYTPVNVNGQPIFPYVTTSNDEIIAYVLRSTTAAANTGSISFYVDDYRPRAVFPSTIQPAPAGANPSRVEEIVTINNIDTTNGTPPYTLYRVSVTDVKNNSLGTPVAENIRSLNFQYYTDFNGSTLLTDAGGGTTGRDAGNTTPPWDITTNGAIGGDGKYDPNNIGTTTNFNDRIQRAQIASVRVSLVGMNASPDLQGYTNATETYAPIKSYRQYALSSLVVPRNLGLTGFPEPNFNAPAPPTIVGLCLGHCGAPVISWTAPSTGGEVTSYRIEWDTVQNGAFSTGIDIADPTARSAILPDDGASDVSLTRYFRMKASNDNGQSPPSGLWSGRPQNKTKPQPPTAFAGTGGQANKVPMSWTSPANNMSGQDQLACSGTGSTSGTVIPPQEIIKYRVVRSADNFNADPGVTILDGTDASQPPPVTGGAPVTWTDQGANSGQRFLPANCTPYYYKVAALDRCYKQNSWNASNNAGDSVSNFSSVIGPFQSTASTAPAPPATVSIDKTTVNATGCPDPQNLSSSNCRITLNWQAVLTDIASPADVIGIDSYVLTRASRLQQTGGAYVADTLFGPNGSREVNCSTGICPVGYSQLRNSATRTFVDTPPWLNNGGLVLEYQYTLAAKNCSYYSGNSPYSIVQAAMPPNPQVAYPGCSTNPTIVENGGDLALSGSGDSPTSLWVLNSGDTVKVTPGAGSTVTSVEFDLYTWPTPVEVGNAITINSPGNSTPAGSYIYTWNDQAASSLYTLRITVNTQDAQGNPCQEVHLKYIEQEPPAPCFFTAASSAPGPAQGNGSNATGTFDFTTATQRVTNVGTESMKFSLPAPNSFTGDMKITWSDTTGQHPEMVISQVEWDYIDPILGPTLIATVNVNSPNSFNGSTGIGTSTMTTTVPAPTNTVNGKSLADIPIGASLGFKVFVKYDATKGNKNLAASMISKLCIEYRIATEPTSTKHCNRVGQAATTANPNSCD